MLYHVLAYLGLGYLNLVVVTLVFKREPMNAVAVLGIILLWPLVLVLIILIEGVHGLRELFA